MRRLIIYGREIIKLNAGRWGVLALAGVMVACSTTGSPEEFTAYLNDRQAQRIAIQICFPDKTAFFDEIKVDVTDLPLDIPYAVRTKMFREAKANGKYENPYASAKKAREYEVLYELRRSSSPVDISQWPFWALKVDNTKGLWGEGSLPIRLHGSTYSNQPVYFGYSRERPGDLRALQIGIQLNKNRAADRKVFWFKPPIDGLRTNEYTEWLAPVLEEDEEVRRAQRWPTSSILFSGKEIPTSPVGKDAPKVRYKLLNIAEDWASTRKRVRAQDAASLGRLSNGESSEGFHSRSTIDKPVSFPSC